MKPGIFLIMLIASAVGCSSKMDSAALTTSPKDEGGDTENATAPEAYPTELRTSTLEKLIEKHESAHRSFIESVRHAAGDPDLSGTARAKYSEQDFPQQFLDFAIAEDDEASLDSCRYLISTFYVSQLRFDAIDYVVQHHLNKIGIDQFFMALVHHYALEPAADACLRAGMEASSKATRAHATYQLALLNLQRRDWCLDSSEERQNYVDSLGKDAVDYLLSDAGADEIAKLLEQVVTDYPNERYFDYSISKRAAQSLFALRNLEVGCEVPAVVSKDSKGRELRIRDQKGSVVVVCFWAHWCGICMESLPRETAFVSSMKGRPFVWLGVNGDNDIELLRDAESSGKVNFQSWHDGQEGAIATQWNIWGFPSLFVIDDEGIIRYKSRGHVDLDTVFPIVEELVATIEADR